MFPNKDISGNSQLISIELLWKGSLNYLSGEVAALDLYLNQERCYTASVRLQNPKNDANETILFLEKYNAEYPGIKGEKTKELVLSGLDDIHRLSLSRIAF